jgi:predicted component of type VI protein secretion system
MTWLKEMANFVQSVWTPALNTDLSKQVPPVEVVIYLLKTHSFSATNSTNDCILTK